MANHLRHVAMLFAASALAACGAGNHESAAAQSTPPPASIAVHSKQVQREQVWDGVVEAVNQVTITAQTNARVQELPYDVNDVVTKGAVLVRLSDVEQKSADNAARAQIASAQASYDEALASFKRYAVLSPNGDVSKEQLDQQRARRDTALAALQAAQAQYKQVAQALDYTVLRAPYAGIITHRYVQVGEAVQAGPPSPQSLIAMESLDSLRVDVQVPQSAVTAIRRFHSANVLLAANGSHRLAAESVGIFPYADPATHTFTVRLQLPGGDNGLYPGMTVKVAFATGQVQRLLVPTSTLVQRGEIVAVYVVDAHAVTLRQVRTGNHYGEQVEILAGLDDGERIATDPVAAIKYLVEQHTHGASAHE